jgi:hypothetical protein
MNVKSAPCRAQYGVLLCDKLWALLNLVARLPTAADARAFLFWASRLDLRTQLVRTSMLKAFFRHLVSRI